MSVTLKFTFPAGRYHATPWGRHVNEGAVEWPPSPWRLLRALVAVWKRTRPDVPDDLMRGLLTKLAEAPVFQLPPHRVAHTRHYMPLNTKSPVEAKGGGTTLVFDTFVAVGRADPLLVHWPHADLTPAEREALESVAGNLTSLGRAEAWVHVELSDAVPTTPCVPVDSNGEVSDGADVENVLCPDPATAFESDHYPKPPTKAKLKQGLRASERLFDAPRWHLCLDTETVHDNKWPRVPGSRWVAYARPAARETPRPAAPARERPCVTVVRFLLDGPALPLAVDAVAVAEAFRRAAMSRFQTWCRQNPDQAGRFARGVAKDGRPRFASPILAGKNADGQMLMSHGHAHYLPTAETDRRRLTNVTIYAPDGFGPEEVAGLTGVRRVEVKVGPEGMELQAQLVGLGTMDNFRGIGLFGPSKVWVSATPFVAHRHLKRRGTKKDTAHFDPNADPREEFVRLAVREAAEQLRGAGLLACEPAGVDVVLPGPGQPPAAAFRRTRERDRGRGYGRACGLVRLTFAEPTTGPLCLGYGSHFGLGLFVPHD